MTPRTGNIALDTTERSNKKLATLNPLSEDPPKVLFKKGLPTVRIYWHHYKRCFKSLNSNTSSTAEARSYTFFLETFKH